MGKDTVIDDLRILTAEDALSRIGKLIAKMNDANRIRVLRALFELYREDVTVGRS
jgi:hypothetical protein